MHRELNGTLFLAANNTSTVESVSALLRGAVSRVIIPDISADMVRAFDDSEAKVIVFAFNEVEQAVELNERLRQQSQRLHSRPCRLLVLCDKFEVERAFDLCCKGVFDNYIVFWPMAYDPHRLKMSILQEFRELDKLERTRNRVKKLADLHKAVTALEAIMARQLEGGHALTDTVKSVLALKYEQTAQAGPLRDTDRDHREGAGIEALYQRLENLGRMASSFEALSRKNCQSSKAALSDIKTFRGTILVVEDDAFHRNLMVALLSAGGYQVLVAPSAEEALLLLQETTPDLVLMDINMPGMSGLDAIRIMRQNDWSRHVPVIVISGNNEKDVIVESVQLGASTFIVKPFSRQVLLNKVQAVLHSTRPAAPREVPWNMM
ncbi:response regulator [Oceanimonas pelagia]|uniref:Response regulator n=1 Tax=Oceanimonas pelagia TaxID=3028314 RepID=A0AA50KQH7_9GAMM|nr:response regulator [Oceanimonas pelagia]WMC11262.1 response regulator [Oceanimonas pelagia]